MGSDIIAIQEHAVDAAWLEAAKARLGALGFGLMLTGPDPEAGRPSAGAAVAVRRPIGHHLLEPRTQAFQDAVSSGRAILTLIAMGPRTPCVVVSFYGW
eukprot:1445008-Alexandrium_andersonii.AAC.1